MCTSSVWKRSLHTCVYLFLALERKVQFQVDAVERVLQQVRLCVRAQPYTGIRNNVRIDFQCLYRDLFVLAVDQQ